MNFQRSFSILGNSGAGLRILDGSSQVKYIVPEKLQVNTVTSPYNSNWVCVLFEKRYTLQSAIEFLCTTLEIEATSDRLTSIGLLIKQNESYYRYQLSISTNFSLDIKELQLSQEVSRKFMEEDSPEQLDFYKNADFEFGLDFSSVGSSTFTVITRLSFCFGGDFVESDKAPQGTN